LLQQAPVFATCDGRILLRAVGVFSGDGFSGDGALLLQAVGRPANSGGRRYYKGIQCCYLGNHVFSGDDNFSGNNIFSGEHVLRRRFG
jgi:hypothetical protein